MYYKVSKKVAKQQSESQELDEIYRRLVQLKDTVNTKKAAQAEGQYSLSVNAKSELHKALYDLTYRGEIRLKDNTPRIMLSHKGVNNRPMVMNISHIRENVFTESESRALGLKIDKHTHYHGLGDTAFLEIIECTCAYRRGCNM